MHARSCSLKVGGACIPQSMAQLRYVGRAHQLYGSSNLEATMIDALLDGLRDLSMKLRPVLRTVSIHFCIGIDWEVMFVEE